MVYTAVTYAILRFAHAWRVRSFDAERGSIRVALSPPEINNDDIIGRGRAPNGYRESYRPAPVIVGPTHGVREFNGGQSRSTSPRLCFQRALADECPAQRRKS